jgi:hypothetical protein
LSWDIAKHINQCCHFNSIGAAYGFEIALRDIAIGDLFTDEYALFNDKEETALPALPLPRLPWDILSPGDFDRFYLVWDRQIRAARKCLGACCPALVRISGYTDQEGTLRLYRNRSDR